MINTEQAVEIIRLRDELARVLNSRPFTAMRAKRIRALSARLHELCPPAVAPLA